MLFNDCPNCFKNTNNNTICPKCGFDKSRIVVPNGVLEPFTLIKKRYLVGYYLGRDDCGIMYHAKDSSTNRICMLKEFMPSGSAYRNKLTNSISPGSDEKSRQAFDFQKMKFKDEAQSIMKVSNNPIVPKVIDYFTQNNTMFIATEELIGNCLGEIIRLDGGRLDPYFAQVLFIRIAEALAEMHDSGVFGRNLCPDNIMVTNDGIIKLISFAEAKYDYYSGYVPPELFYSSENYGPWCDIYSLCAITYEMISGTKPRDAISRMNGMRLPPLAECGCSVDRKFSYIISKGMELDLRNRYSDFRQLLNNLKSL